MEPTPKKLKLDDSVPLNQDENVPIIRKVNFSFEHNGDASVDQQTTMLVLNHLSQAGRIDTLEVESHSTKTYGCVQFCKSEPADHLLKNPEMEYGGVQVQLWKAKDQPSGELKIVDLNDDCLQKIFCYLGSNDLKRVGDVNKIFRYNSHAVFALRNKTMKYSLLQKFATKEYMQNYGHRIKHFEIEDNVNGLMRRRIGIKESTLQLIASYCSLTELSLHGIQSIWLKAITEIFPPVLPGLIKLTLSSCRLSQRFIEMLRGCSELTTLYIVNCLGDWELPAFNIPKLHSFYFHNTNEIGNVRNNVSVMLVNNTQLKKVGLIHRNLDNDTMNTIANNLPLIENISLGRPRRLQQFSLELGNPNALQHLKKIKIGTMMCRDFEYPSSIMEKLAEAQIPLEHVEILSANVPANNFIENLPTLNELYLIGSPHSMPTVSLDDLDNLRDLRVLVIGKCFTVNGIGLLKLISNNQNLHKINFGHHDFQINSELYKELVNILEHRPQKIPLKIVLSLESFKRIDYPQTHPDLLCLCGGGIYEYVATVKE